jgi:hypothetical protein
MSSATLSAATLTHRPLPKGAGAALPAAAAGLVGASPLGDRAAAGQRNCCVGAKPSSGRRVGSVPMHSMQNFAIARFSVWHLGQITDIWRA